MTLRIVDWFCGAGGATQGTHAVPGVTPILAANHDQLAIDSHSANFPTVEHFRGDIKDLDVAKHPYAELFWASPECTNWSVAKGKTADYAKEPALFGDDEPDEDVMRSRALMQDVIRYLRGMDLRQQPVLAGVVENVVDIRRWTLWGQWRAAIEDLGYRTRLIALNSMHAKATATPRAPQSRDRLYLAYWHKKLGRDPDWDKWLRPECWCPGCEAIVAGIQTWKRTGQDMGRYGAQYYYRCPKVTCSAKVEPYYVPAREAIDWSIEGQRIGDRDRPLSPKTMARITAALTKWGPAIVEAAGNQYDSHDPKHPQHGRRNGYSRSWPLTDPLRTLHTTATKALVLDSVHGAPIVRSTDEPLATTTTAYTRSLLVPVEGREGKQAFPDDRPLRTQTARNDLGLLVTLRGQNAAKQVSEPMDTVAASGNHHGLLIPSGGTWHTEGYSTQEPMRTVTTRENHGLLVPYYGNAGAGTHAGQPIPTLTSHDRFALIMTNNHANPARRASDPMPTLTTANTQAYLEPPTIDPMDCLFRMLEPHEIGAGMAFLPDYIVLGNKRQRVKQYGNAVTPPVAEVLVSALVECIQGHDLEVAA